MEAWEAFEKWENEVWFSLYKYCNGNEVFLNVIIPLIILLSVYWSVGALFTLVDFTGKPHFIIKYKIPDPTITKYPVHGDAWIVSFLVLPFPLHTDTRIPSLSSPQIQRKFRYYWHIRLASWH
ncbi:hypothetical protein HNY73_020705 [Argiope bruennichi]|uniref:Uncharacterized protein n=1 Tax=Argiope bruennichi TaxID=94029 RepID=A0A8T0E8K4_ARGBR|nr:hypothetical protein HNY73_020705 [Argiope bruennichi]